jgi:hypothetical protein
MLINSCETGCVSFKKVELRLGIESKPGSSGTELERSCVGIELWDSRRRQREPKKVGVKSGNLKRWGEKAPGAFGARRGGARRGGARRGGLGEAVR